MYSFFRNGQDESKYHFVHQVAQYDHDEGNAISFGYAYEGDIEVLKNKYIFDDIVSGRVFYVNTQEIELGRQDQILEFDLSFNGVLFTFKKIIVNVKTDLRFGLGAISSITFLLKLMGKILKLIWCKAIKS
ncbi:MAG: hypothetical protein H7223_03455 [Pedobacter sp.]|nr:hypothetical protein [Pedobacter sp.]